MRREKLFELWCEISQDAEHLRNIMQNPLSEFPPTPEDIEVWGGNADAFMLKAQQAIDETWKLLDRALKKQLRTKLHKDT